MNQSDNLKFRLFTVQIAFIAVASLFISACAPHQYQSEPVDTQQLLNEMQTWTLDDPGLKQFFSANGLTEDELTASTFSFKRLYLTGLFYDPKLRIAYNKWQKAELALQNSAYRINPELSIPFEHHSDTSDGQSPWTIGAVLSFIYERRGKREARQALAEVAVFNASLELLQLAHDKYDAMLDTYHEFLITKQRLFIIDDEIAVLEQLLTQLQTDFELGAASQFEISTFNLRLQQRLFEKSLYENRLLDQRERLLLATHLAHKDFDRITIAFIEPIKHANGIYKNNSDLLTDLVSLQGQLVDTHIGLARELNAYAETEATLKLEIEQQYPDIVLSPGFIFDQSDNIWTLGASWILPLFNNSKKNLNILTALEDRKIQQREILNLQKQLLDSLYQRQQSVKRQKNMISTSDEFVSANLLRIEQMERQVELGGINNTIVLRNQLEFYKAKLNQLDVYQQAIRAMQNLQQILYINNVSINIKSILQSWLDVAKEASL